MKLAVILIGSVVVIGLILVLIFSSSNPDSSNGVNNVTMVEGEQIVTISAKGGYSPRNTEAKADVLTVLKVVTRGTFDCSSALVIPQLGYRAMLPQSGETLIDVPPQRAGTVLQGICAMGMYSFTLKFS